MMEVPVYIDGDKVGTVVLEQQGTMTEVRVRMRDVGRVVRLYLFGEREAYLGVPVPDEASGELILTRRLTPNEMGSFPRRPAYGAEKRIGQAGAETEQMSCPEEDGEAEPRGRHVLWHGGRPHYF